MKSFFLIFFTLYGLINFYFFIKLKSAISLKWQIHIFFGIFLLIMIFTPVLIRIFEKNGYELLAIGLSWIGYLWMAFVVIFLFFGVITDFSKLLISFLSKISGQNFPMKIPSISYFLLPLIFSIIFLIYGYFEALNIKTEKITIKTNKITKNIRIVQISDVHIGLIIREDRIKRITDKVKQANPDIFVSTGDLVDAQIDRLNHIAEIIREIKPKYGKFAITGNHEFYAGLSQALSFTEKAGFEILRDRGLTIKELNLNIAGFDDTEARRYEIISKRDRVSLLTEFKNKGFTILLKHRPSIDRELTEYFDLQLSGHTHKGQFFPFSLLTHIYYNNNNSGLIEIGKDKFLYINRGTGTWGPPIRIFAPPASQGLLTVLVSGDKTAFEKAKPLLEKLGKNIFYLEKEGLATKMKLINNLVLGSFMVTLAEAIVFAEDTGIDKEKAIDILLSGAGNSMILNVKKQKLLQEDFTAHFSNELIYKDLDYLQDLAKSLKRPLFTGSIAKELYAITLSKGFESEDFSGIYRIFKNFSAA